VPTFGMCFVVAGFALSACAAENATTIHAQSSPRLKEISPSELKMGPMTPETSAPKQTESARPPANPAPAEISTPEEAAQARAADPKDTSGAIIIKVPVTGAKP
jgi:hypothetical protein